MEYKHKAVQKLYGLYQEHKDELGKGISPMTMIWRSISPGVPDMLKVLDDEPDMLAKLKGFVDSLSQALKEDVGEEK